MLYYVISYHIISYHFTRACAGGGGGGGGAAAQSAAPAAGAAWVRTSVCEVNPHPATRQRRTPPLPLKTNGRLTAPAGAAAAAHIQSPQRRAQPGFVPVSVKKTGWENQLSKDQISGWIAISAAGLQGKGLDKRNCFSQTPVPASAKQTLILLVVNVGLPPP